LTDFLISHQYDPFLLAYYGQPFFIWRVMAKACPMSLNRYASFAKCLNNDLPFQRSLNKKY